MRNNIKLLWPLHFLQLLVGEAMGNCTVQHHSLVVGQCKLEQLTDVNSNGKGRVATSRPIISLVSELH